MLAWARSLIFFVYMASATVILMAALAPTLVMSDRAQFAGMRFWAQTILGGLRIICGVSHTVDGADNIPERGAVIAANHQSMWETIAFMAILERPVTVYKKELQRLPIYALWGRRAGIAIDREAGVRSIRALTAAAKGHLAEDRQIIVFPEGTRTAPGRKRPFQSGVAAVYSAVGAPCVPVAHNSGEHWRHPGPLKSPGVISIRFLPPIEPGLSRKEFSRRLEHAITNARPDLKPPATARENPPLTDQFSRA